jgi:imidazolonepropionase-like amidohydrolase
MKILSLTLFAFAVSACAATAKPLTSEIVVRSAPLTPDSGSIAVLCGHLIDGKADKAIENGLVVIRDGKVTNVTPHANLAQAAAAHLPVLDLSQYSCLPGLIDMHTHLLDNPEDTSDLTIDFTRSNAEWERIGRENALSTLLGGFTSVRNVGVYVEGTDVSLRNAINRGEVPGPRMQASGPYLTIPHGGGDLYIPDYKEPADNARFHAGVAKGPQQFREQAEKLLRNDSDVLKVIASGAVLAFGGVPGAPEMSQEEIAAVVEVAHHAGKKVAAHAHGAESIRAAIAAGVDTVEHASYLDDAGIAAAIKQGHVAFSMDVYNGDYIDTEGRRQKWPEEFLRKNVETTEVQRQGFTKAVAAGAPIVFGTDAGVYPHGLNARQFPIMVARGMTPMQAIKAATSVAAKFMGWEDRIGSLDAGKFGDLIAVHDDPLGDIASLQHVEVVIKGGMPFKLPSRK